MSIQLTLLPKDAETLLLAGLDEFLAGLLREVPSAGTPSEGNESRLFPDPTRGREPEADEDWSQYVRPELEEWFADNRQVVARDLKGLCDRGARGMEMEIPLAHLGAWIHALNQARLALTELHRLQERELDEDLEASGLRGLVLFQVQFYGLMQEWLLAHTDSL